ncbi:hypothetical protein AGMMS49982_12460 [Bacteroidia bacterium]|nr:hypothetical protein AGMMS49982_12460 [Bacteroidia bacterium]
MYDKILVQNSLLNIENSLQELLDWTCHISTVDDFLTSSHGMMSLNAACMKLFAVGEEVKNIDKRTEKTLLALYPSIEWREVMKMRDVIAHHYFDIDAEKIFTILRVDVPPLLSMVKQIQKDLLKDKQ